MTAAIAPVVSFLFQVVPLNAQHCISSLLHAHVTFGHELQRLPSHYTLEIHHVIVVQPYKSKVLDHTHDLGKVRFQVVNLLVALGHSKFLENSTRVSIRVVGSKTKENTSNSHNGQPNAQSTAGELGQP